MSMLDNLPEIMRESQYVRDVYDGFEVLREVVENAHADMEGSLFVSTASGTGLALWEDELGIDTAEDATVDDRRSAILAKLRGQGTCTPEMVRAMAASFSGGEVEITENAAEYAIEVKFVGTIGIPPNMDDFKAAIEAVKPAHIAYTLAYVFVVNDTLKKYTHAGLAAYTHEKIRTGGIESGNDN